MSPDLREAEGRNRHRVSQPRPLKTPKTDRNRQGWEAGRHGPHRPQSAGGSQAHPRQRPGHATPEELRNQEAGASPEQEQIPDNESEQLYKPSKAKEIKGRFSRRAKAAIGTGIIGTGLGGLMYFGVLQGPLEFIHSAQLIERFQFSRVDSFTDRLSGRYLAYALAGKTARGRLGVIGNRLADRWDARFERGGLKAVYSPGTQRGIGFQITDRDAVSRHFLRAIEALELSTNSTFPNGAVDMNGNPIDTSITGVNLSNVSDFRIRNRVTRAAVQSLEVNRIGSALGARLLIRFNGTDGLYHPWRNRVRRAADSYAEYRQQRRDEENNRQRTGDLETDAGETRSGRLRRKFGTALRTARAPAAVAVAVVCGGKAFSESIDQQNHDNQMTGMNMALTAIARGSQTMSFEDLNLDEMRVDQEHFYNPENDTSWVEDPGIQYEMGQQPTGRDFLAELNLKPGTPKPEILNRIDSIPTGFSIGGQGVDICGIIQATGEIVESAVPGYRQAMGLVDNSVSAVIEGFSGRSTEEWQQWLLDRYASNEASTAARGALWGGMVNVFGRLAANQQMKLTGGRQMSAEEEQGVRRAAAAERREAFAQASVFERYFDVTNTQSMAGSIALRAPKTRGEAASSLSRLASIPSVASSLFSNLFGKSADAQDVPSGSYDYGFPMYDFSIEEQTDERFENPFEVGEYYFDNPSELDQMNEEYGEDCFGMTISQSGDLQYERAEEGSDLTQVPDKCTQGVLGANTDGQVLGIQEANLLRYRYYIAYTVNGHALNCAEYDDEEAQESCDQVYGRINTAPEGGGGNIPTGGACPEPSPGNNPGPGDMVDVRGIMVHPCIAQNLENMLAAAEAAGIHLTGSAYRSEASQVELRRTNGCPDIYESPASSCAVPTARPGSSNHNVGTAVDFQGMCFPNATCPSNPGYNWLVANAATYNFFKLSSEAWHWSVNGN